MSEAVGTSSVGSGAPARPVVAALVEGVVDPGEPAAAGVFLDRVELPVGAAEAGAGAEAQDRQRLEPEQLRQVLVRAVLPPGGPDQVVVGGEAAQPLAGLDRDAVGHPVDEREPAGGVLDRALEAEQADHAVDVDGEDGFLGSAAGATRGRLGRGGAPSAARYHSAAVPTTSQLVRKGRKAPRKKVVDARPEVGSGPQGAHRRPAAPGRLHARLHRHAEEAELGSAQGRARPADQRDGGHLLHPGRGPQPPGALRRARPRRSRQGPAGRPLQGRPRHARRLRRLRAQAVALQYGVKAS